MSARAPSSATLQPYVRPGFLWDAADAFLFDIDGTLLNSRDAVHFSAFHAALRDALGVEPNLDGLWVHGNTDIGILRAALEQEGLAEARIASQMQRIVAALCTEVSRNGAQMRPELCPSIRELILRLRERGKLLGVASGNLEPVGWMKLQRAGIHQAFSFGSFSWPMESRAEIFCRAVALAQKQIGDECRICFVGDTPADVQAARAAGGTVIAMATGIYDFAALRACDPDACCASAADLLAIT